MNQRFLFRFGFESPSEWLTNNAEGTDFESSEAVWVETDSEQHALEIGVAYAQRWVGDQFDDAQIETFRGWREANYAHWIECPPSEDWTASELEALPTIRG